MKADLLIIDGRHMLWRTHDAFGMLSAEIDGKNVPTGGLYGFLNVAPKVHSRWGGRLVVAWEGRNNFRNELYPQYKGKHEPITDPAKLEFIREMAQQEAWLKDLLSKMGVRQYEGVRCEADDVIGRLATTVGSKGKRVVIYSGDSDLRQLVTGAVTTVSPAKGKIRETQYGPAEVEEKHGVAPEKIAELKALSGDGSDNIPGVRGIGPKTAAALLNHYGSLDEVIRVAGFPECDVTWPVAARFRDAIRGASGLLPLYLKLTTIKTDCEMKAITPAKRQSDVVEALKAFKFRSLISPPELRGLMNLGEVI
jgi:DNA polymerase-1